MVPRTMCQRTVLVALAAIIVLISPPALADYSQPKHAPATMIGEASQQQKSTATDPTHLNGLPPVVEEHSDQTGWSEQHQSSWSLPALLQPDVPQIAAEIWAQSTLSASPGRSRQLQSAAPPCVGTAAQTAAATFLQRCGLL